MDEKGDVTECPACGGAKFGVGLLCDPMGHLDELGSGTCVTHGCRLILKK